MLAKTEQQIEVLELRVLNVKNSKQLEAVRMEAVASLRDLRWNIPFTPIEGLNDLNDSIDLLESFLNDLPESYQALKERREVRASYSYTLICENRD
jgi:hypothetical protein